MAAAAAAATRVNGAVKLSQLAWPSTSTIPEALSLSARSKSFYTSLFIQQQRNPKKPRTRTSNILFCSTRPGLDSDNATNSNNNNNSAIRLGSDAVTRPPTTTTVPDQALSSTIPKGLVLDLGPENSWDRVEIGSPVVKRYIGDDEERWYMWYHGRSDEDNPSEYIGLAVSGNGVHWSRGDGPVRSSGDVGLVMNCREQWWAFDTQSIRPSELVIMSSPMYSAVYWLYYTGFSSDQVELPNFPRLPLKNQELNKVFKSLPGLACSQDGRHWARIEGDCHSGALLDVGNSGEDWDSLFIAAPKVILHENDDLRMYYHSFDAQSGEFGIGVARSRDGIRWVKLGKVLGGGKGSGCFDELGVMNGHVVRDSKNGKYVMAYEGVGKDGERSIGLVVSADGLKNWVRVQENAVLGPSEEDGWDDGGVGAPCLVHMEGNANEWRIYYRGIGKNGRTGIGMAASQGSEMRIFQRWEGFQL